MMKKYIKNQIFKLLIFCIVILHGCKTYVGSPKSQTTDYQIVDTFFISKNNFDKTLEYNKEIIKVNSTYYSIWKNKDGKLIVIYKIVK